MAISREDVKKIANLAKLGLKEDDIDKFQKQLTSILGYLDKMAQIDVEGVEETSQVTGLTNVSVPDVVDSDFAKPEEMLDCSPLPVVARQIKVKKVI